MALSAIGRRLGRGGWKKRGKPPAPPPSPGPGGNDPDDPIQHLIDALDDPLLVIEATHVTHANHAARDLFGAYVAGGDVRLVLRHPDAIALIADEEEGPVELTGLGGHDRHWVLSARALGPGRRLLRLVDRSTRRAAERMRVDFVANASHELRTPLAALIGFIETLEDANAPEDAAVRLRFLKIMADEARRMQRLIDDLMSLSRIEADRYSPPRATVDLARLLRDTCTGIAAARADGERLAIAIDAPRATVVGDEAQISQVIHNIVDNALKYGRDDTPVRVALAPIGTNMVRLTVEDRGEGIPPRHLPRLTERFYRVDPGRSRAIGGTGLGLAIVKHIVERHRGRLDIDSKVGRGTIVAVDLPLADGPLS